MSSNADKNSSAKRIMLKRVKKENFRYSFIIAILLHSVLFLALFLTLRHSTKLIFQSPPSLQVIHATAVPVDHVLRKLPPALDKIKPLPTADAKSLSKPIVLEKSPVILSTKEKKFLKVKSTKMTSLKVVNKTLSLAKNKVTVKQINPKKPATHKAKKIINKPLQRSKESLTLVEKNVQQLLDQEIKSLVKQQINAAHNAATTDKYRHLILQAIAQQWIIPPKMNKQLEAKLAVHLAPGGMVLDVIIVKSSGNFVLDRSAQTAVYKASPLPVPKNNALFNTFRQINLTVRPEGVMTQ